MQIDEIHHGSQTRTFKVHTGTAEGMEAIDAFQFLRANHRLALDLFCMAASQGATGFTVEVGTLAQRDDVVYSHHDLMRILPRVLANFRGTAHPA